MDTYTAMCFVMDCVKRISEIELSNYEEITDHETGNVLAIKFHAKSTLNGFNIIITSMSSLSLGECILLNIRRSVKYKEAYEDSINYKNINMFNTKVIASKGIVISEEENRVDFIREEFFPISFMEKDDYKKMVESHARLALEITNKSSRLMPATIEEYKRILAEGKL